MNSCIIKFLLLWLLIQCPIVRNNFNYITIGIIQMNTFLIFFNGKSIVFAPLFLRQLEILIYFLTNI
jgi:hypothetical protein